MSIKSKDTWVRIIDVSDTVFHSKGYTLYKVTSKVFPKNSVEAVTEVVVWKRYNDFKMLHKALSTIHQNLYLKGTFPPFAKTRFFGRFDPDVIEERRLSALQLLQFAASSCPLFTSQVFVKFFEEGYVPDNSQQPVESSETTFDVLQQQTCLQPTLASNSKNVSKEESESIQELFKDSSVTCLGGIWQHHQVPDNISLGSQCTDEDDRTIFKDDDCVISRHSLDVTEFDPLLQNNQRISELDKSISSHMNLCNSWLLSALESCSESVVDKDTECISEFPIPFNELEFLDNGITRNNELMLENFTSDSKQNSFTFDLPSPVTDEPSLTSEFDPLLNAEMDLRDNKEDMYIPDEFAMTPNAYQNESSQRPTYITLAAKYVESAQVAEEAMNYLEAFEAYKKAIEVLLQGIQRDKCSDLKYGVKKKVLLYLMRAEELYENKLPKVVNSKDAKFDSSLAVPFLKKMKNVQDNVEELSRYKVIGILDKALLVLDISNNKTFVAKAIYKSLNARRHLTAPVVSQNGPFMVKLHHVYETSYSIFLILEYAIGGRLWNYMSSFFQRRPLSPIEDGTCLHIDTKTKTDLSNAYSGKKISDPPNLDFANLANIDTNLTPSECCPLSYIALITKYADLDKTENYIALSESPKFSKQLSKHLEIDVHEVIEIDDKGKNLHTTFHHKNVRNRLLSSTGSLETAFSQKTCLLDAFNAMDEAVSQVSSKSLLPESCVVLWAAEIILAFEHLHNHGIIWMDFHPDNILLGPEGHILLTYQSLWNNVDFTINESAKENLFCAPEVGNIFPVISDCDWWSLGAVLFELLTGQSLVSCHPTGITRHTILFFPTDISLDAKDLITKLLQYNHNERLGSGIYGVEEIKSHPFFHSIDWKSLCER